MREKSGRLSKNGKRNAADKVFFEEKYNLCANEGMGAKVRRGRSPYKIPRCAGGIQQKSVFARGTNEGDRCIGWHDCPFGAERGNTNAVVF